MDIELDILGQTPNLSIYTQICLCYSVVDVSPHAAIVETLARGLERLSASFPWIAGQVVNEGAGNGSSGVFKIKPLEATPRMVVKDLTYGPSIPTLADLRRANFPSAMLDEGIIAPRYTIPTADESASGCFPVFLVQLTFIAGGLLLTLVGQHQVMDMTGQGHIIDLLSKACSGEPFTAEELSHGNLPRHDLIPLLDSSYEPGPELASQIVKPGPAPPPPTPPMSSWVYFTFSPHALAALKALATETLPPDTTAYVSTDDALSAFAWHSTLARAVDVRPYLDIPPTYPGLVQSMAYHALPLSTLAASPLGVPAARLRAAVDPATSALGRSTRALATLLSRAGDRAAVSFTAAVDPAADLMLSSWARLDCYALTFGLGLGVPVAVRRPQFVPVESLVYLMPRTGDGEIAVMICLRDKDMERLVADEEFAKYGVFVG